MSVLEKSLLSLQPMFDLTIDEDNKRILVRSINPAMWEGAKAKLFEVAEACEAEKIIVWAREEDVRLLLAHGFEFEATVDSFLREEPVFYMSRFMTADRREAAHWVMEDELLEQVRLTEGRSLPPLNPQMNVRLADADDIPQLTALYKETFETYPSPLTDPDYLQKSLEDHVFAVVEIDGDVVSTAAAEIDREFLNAEITNCATHPEFRGHGLMRQLINTLEKKLVTSGITNAFSIARARSFGMNAALHQTGYSYGGRLVNNCHICGDYEDMNVWGKSLNRFSKGVAK